jgi:hypothetical protein
LQQRKEASRWADIEILKEDYSYEWASIHPIFEIPKKG